MTLRRTLAVSASMLLVLTTGCYFHDQPAYSNVQQPPPPPPAWAQNNPLVRMGYRNGFHDGRSDGERDFRVGGGYRPQADPRFRIAPGYVERYGPFDLYRDSYQDAYVRGYDNGFQHAQMDR